MATVDGGGYAKLQSAIGTPATLAGADAIDYHSLTFEEVSAETARPVVRGTRWRPPSKAPWRRHWSISGELEVKHLNLAAVATEPELGRFLRVCGWTYDGTGAATGTHVYSLAGDPSGAPGLSLRKEMRRARDAPTPGGLRVDADDVSGGLVLEWPEEAELVARLTALGAFNEPVTQGTPLVGAYSPAPPATGVTSIVVHDDYEPGMRSLTLDSGISPALRADGGQVLWPAHLQTVSPSGALVVELVDAAEIDWWAKYRTREVDDWTIESQLGNALITLLLEDVSVGRPEHQTAEPNTMSLPFEVHGGATLTWSDETPP